MDEGIDILQIAKAMKRKKKELDVDVMGTGESLTVKEQALISAFIAANKAARESGAKKATASKIQSSKKAIKKV